jgi:RNA polymerase sigma-70 factor (ECF subfamily)
MDANQSFNDLMSRLRAGQDDAAAQVFQRYAGRLIGLARSRLDRVLRQKVDPEDILQSVFRSFFVRHAAGQFEVGNWDSFWALLTVITIRKCAGKAQHFRRGRRDVQQEAAADLAGGNENWQSLSREPTPEEAAMLTDTVEAVMRRLDERDREILALSLQGKGIREISTEIGFAERTVRRSLDHIRQHLEEMQEQTEL